MSELLTLAQFRKVRDEIALESMTERLRALTSVSQGLYSQYHTLRYELQETKDRNKIDALTYALYIKPSGEYGDKGGIAWQWQTADAQMNDILRDSRYQNSRNKRSQP